MILCVHACGSRSLLSSAACDLKHETVSCRRIGARYDKCLPATKRGWPGRQAARRPRDSEAAPPTERGRAVRQGGRSRCGLGSARPQSGGTLACSSRACAPSRAPAPALCRRRRSVCAGFCGPGRPGRVAAVERGGKTETAGLRGRGPREGVGVLRPARWRKRAGPPRRRVCGAGTAARGHMDGGPHVVGPQLPSDLRGRRSVAAPGP